MPPSVSRVLLCFAALAAHAGAVELTSLVDMFIGTASGANGGSGGNAFPGAAIPHAMAKVGQTTKLNALDAHDRRRQAGYIHDNSSITGISLMHDEGTGGNTNGGYGIFPLFPLTNCTFASCPVGIGARAALRAAGADAAQPGYFTTTFTNNIKLETTSTRRAGLIRFTYPTTGPNHVVVDLTNDLQRSFEGGSISISAAGRVKLGGTFLQLRPLQLTVYACYDFLPPHDAPTFSAFGTYQSASLSAPSTIAITANSTGLSFAFNNSVSPEQAGALLSFTGSTTVLARFGVSFHDADHACANAEAEVPAWDWDADVLSRIAIDTEAEDATIVELLYSSLYRSALVPANLTDENPYWDSPYPFYDAFFCSWDTFRTVHPLLSILSPREWSEIVNAYVDGWRHTCRANTKAGYVQGGSDGMVPLGDFAVKYAAHAAELGVPTDDLFQRSSTRRRTRCVAAAQPPDWYTIGRQNTAWKQFGYIPTDWVDPSGATGLPTREASRAYEAALALDKAPGDVVKYSNRSMNFVNMWNPDLTSDGFSGFAQRRYPNGTFAFSPPNACSPVDPVGHSCARGRTTTLGSMTSSWEYSFFAPHSMSTLVGLMGGMDTFVTRRPLLLCGYYAAGNEPGFLMPWAYHYANRPDLSALRVRKVVYSFFGTGIGGIPGNDDSGAMAALLTFHLLGLYPVAASRQLLIGSPLLSAYTLRNDLLGTSTAFRVTGFDKAGLAAAPPVGARVYVKSITIDGKPSASLCWIAFEDVVGGGTVEIEVDGDAAAAAAAGCGPGPDALPDSLETGGFSK
ncbi:glycosyl hydrolase family 92-domain-containing protein [Mycena sp. CBHHK59/15]|nr:glycosyl hydrolase family 92-domain-containing protein [Mycena sp. CBHHK59/15]